MGAKKIILIAAAGVAATGVTFIGIPFLGNACGCYDTCFCKDCNSSEQAVDPIEPGSYALTKLNFNKFLTLNVSGGKYYGQEWNFFEKCWGLPQTFKYNSPQDGDCVDFHFVPTVFNNKEKVKVNGEMTARKTLPANYVFEDCSVEMQVTINNETNTYSIPLDKTGDTMYSTPRFGGTAYEFICSYRLLSCSGTVFVPPNENTGAINKGGFKLQYNDGHYEIVGFTSSPKVLTIPSSIDVGTGDIPIKNLKTIFKYNFDLNRYPGQDLPFTQTIIFDGNYDAEDLNFTWNLYDSISKNNFTSIKNIVIRNISGGYISPTFVLPPSGVNFYVNDNTSQRGFVGALNNASFVNGIYSFDEYRG